MKIRCAYGCEPFYIGPHVNTERAIALHVRTVHPETQKPKCEEGKAHRWISVSPVTEQCAYCYRVQYKSKGTT